MMTTRLKSGEMGSGEWNHARWCEGCGHYHGPLYDCEKYPADVRTEIQAKTKELETKLSSREWCKEQIRTGKMDAREIMVARYFAGLDDFYVF